MRGQLEVQSNTEVMGSGVGGDSNPNGPVS